MKCQKNIIYKVLLLCSCLILGVILACILSKPISLTEKEISYYTDIAEKVWKDGIEDIEEDENIIINFESEDNKVEILPTNINKESIIVDFSDSESMVTINEPKSTFWGCIVFHGVLFGITIYYVVIICFYELKKKKKHK